MCQAGGAGQAVISGGLGRSKQANQSPAKMMNVREEGEKKSIAFSVCCLLRCSSGLGFPIVFTIGRAILRLKQHTRLCRVPEHLGRLGS